MYIQITLHVYVTVILTTLILELLAEKINQINTSVSVSFHNFLRKFIIFQA